MTEVRFYHLTTQSLEQALPAILNKALAGGRRAVVRFTDEDEAARYNDHLWTYTPDSFLPHGLSKDAEAAHQPVLLTATSENPNSADMLVLCDFKTVPENASEFSLCCDFLNGQNDESVTAGRTRWKSYKDAGFAVTYWQQTDTGGWEQKV